MKCKKILTALLAAACTMSGCHGDLDIMQDNKLSASNMWIDESDAETATYGIYLYMRDALKSGDGATYMRLMNESGRSSEELLNNIITSATGDTKLAQGLDRSRKLLEGKGAWRVHGGGFAGCVQALMPTDYFPTYKEDMEKAFGGGSCREIRLV